MGMENELREGETSTLTDLIIGTVLWGVAICLIAVWFTESRFVFVLSLAGGVAGAIGMAVHMNRSIEYAMEMPEDSAGRYMRKQSMFRMLGAMALALAAYCLKGDVVAIFLGLLTLKPGAYVQPLIHRFLNRNLKKGR